jgi:hypothetical protein
MGDIMARPFDPSLVYSRLDSSADDLTSFLFHIVPLTLKRCSARGTRALKYPILLTF